MGRSPNFDKVKGYYESGMWNLKRLQAAVGKWITEEEYETITGK